MELTKQKLQQLIKEELKALIEGDPALAQALLGKAQVSQDFSEPESEWVDIGERGPTKDDLIRAAELLEIDSDNFRNQLVLYNIATLLRNNPNPAPMDLVKVIRQSWEEDELVGGNEPLQEVDQNKDELISGVLNYLVRNQAVALSPQDAQSIKQKLTAVIQELINQYGRNKR